MSATTEEEKQILALWRDPLFSGSFTGMIKAFTVIY